MKKLYKIEGSIAVRYYCNGECIKSDEYWYNEVREAYSKKALVDYYKKRICEGLQHCEIHEDLVHPLHSVDYEIIVDDNFKCIELNEYSFDYWQYKSKRIS